MEEVTPKKDSTQKCIAALESRDFDLAEDIVAQDLYGKPAASLTAEEAAKVEQEIEATLFEMGI